MTINVIQKLLGVPPSGTIDHLTTAAVRNFQMKFNLRVTGLLDEVTAKKILEYHDDSIVIDSEDILSDHEFTTDLSEYPSMTINKQYLPKDEYFSASSEKSKKEYIFIHHTAGWNNPYKTIEGWKNDSRGRIGTEYVIGGINIKTNNAKYDGSIVKCIPDGFWAGHLGGSIKHGISKSMHKSSIGIEICNFGHLQKQGSKYITWAGQTVPSNQVLDLGKDFRGQRYWHRYTDKQISSLEYLIRSLCNHHNINIHEGLYNRLQSMGPSRFLDYDINIAKGNIKGILSHTNVRKDKFDIFPQQEIINMINRF